MKKGVKPALTNPPGQVTVAQPTWVVPFQTIWVKWPKLLKLERSMLSVSKGPGKLLNSPLYMSLVIITATWLGV